MKFPQGEGCLRYPRPYNWGLKFLHCSLAKLSLIFSKESKGQVNGKLSELAMLLIKMNWLRLSLSGE